MYNFGPYGNQYPYPPMPPQGQFGKPGPGFGEPGYNLDARLDRIEREIIEINHRLNALTRQVRRIENFLNIRDEYL